jgi:hypothetical protein
MIGGCDHCHKTIFEIDRFITTVTSDDHCSFGEVTLWVW